MTNNILKGKRILISGKGGSGKSTLVTLMSDVLQKKGYKIFALDGDASNPRGLAGLMFGLKKEKDFPKALIDFFGGIKKVTCPVDDPSPLTRLNDSIPIPEKKIDILKEIPEKYFLKRKKIILFQAGKIKKYGQGCDGPAEKVVRDFMVKGDYVNLIDAPAGVEHFGRGISKNVDILILVLDPTFESISIAKRVNDFCKDIKMQNFWLILNKIKSKKVESQMMNKLGKLKNRVIGTVQCDSKIIESALEGVFPSKSEALNDIEKIIEKLERIKN
ncbi:MAG: adenylyl-sulfate kinase [Xanthomonadaceae bacterium]|nr:adenylyl-sulfate kinase [Rhodospirillaceae bacterium]NIA18051.1 adenylyl-sulfate kinase [Xanthomonadaceae bacterium]